MILELLLIVFNVYSRNTYRRRRTVVHIGWVAHDLAALLDRPLSTNMLCVSALRSRTSTHMVAAHEICVTVIIHWQNLF